MAIFYRCVNNGVVAFMRQDVWERTEQWAEFIRLMPDRPQEVYPPRPRPIFTFVSSERFVKTHARNFVTGDYALLDRLTEGHNVFNRSFYVPFSNSFELNEGEDGPEHKFRTTVAEVVEAFNLVRQPDPDLLERARERLGTARI